MADDRVFFFPGTADCQPILVAPYPGTPPYAPNAPNNTQGGYGNLLDLSDYNGSTGNANIFVKPDDVGTSAGIRDLMPNYYALSDHGFGHLSWYLVRQTDFKNWIGVSGIFWRKTSFVMEVDILPAFMPALGGFRDEGVNMAAGAITVGGQSNETPYGAGGKQGGGISLKAIVTDPVTHLEVVKDSKIFTAPDGQTGYDLSTISFPRQVVQLNLTDVTPEEMATMILRVTTQQHSARSSFGVPSGFLPQPIADQDSTIYRIGLTPDPASLRSSGKLSAALTTR